MPVSAISSLNRYRRRGSTFGRAILKIDIWRVATLMLKPYGDDAEAESTRRADEHAAVGDFTGRAVWHGIIGAIGQLANTRPPGPGPRPRNFRSARVIAAARLERCYSSAIRRVMLIDRSGRSRQHSQARDTHDATSGRETAAGSAQTRRNHAASASEFGTSSTGGSFNLGQFRGSREEGRFPGIKSRPA